MIDFIQLRDLVVRPVCELFNRAPEATTLLMRIAAHESRGGTYLRQVGDGGGYGPAHGLWQMEPATVDLVDQWAIDHWIKVPTAAQLAWDGMRREHPEAFVYNLHDACLYARMLLYASKWQMPDEDDEEQAYEIYLDVWRPGKPPTLVTFTREYEDWRAS